MSTVRVLGGHAQGCVRSDVRRQARKMGCQAARNFGGWENLPSQGLARRSEPAVCVAVQRLGSGQLIQRSNDGGKGRGSRWTNKFGLPTGVPGTHQWYDGTPATPGSSSASGISNHR